MERAVLRSFDGFQFGVAPRWATTDLIARLFVLPRDDPPVLIDVETLDVLEAENGTFEGSVRPNQVYQVMPRSVVDTSDSEPDEYKAPTDGRPRVISAERITAIRDGARAVAAQYHTPLHRDVYTLNPETAVDARLRAAAAGTIPWAEVLAKQSATGLYTGPVLALDYCRRLVEELRHYEASGLPVRRPNSMNRYGLILEDLGFSDLVDDLLATYIAPLAATVYPGDAAAASLDAHHSFIVEYGPSKDRELNFHYDESDVTLNVCLGLAFEGGDLYFRGLLDQPDTHTEELIVHHRPGYGCLHLGKHRHGAKALTSGERYNLIIWCRSSSAATAHHHAHD